MRTNYVFVDYENVQLTSLHGLNAEQFKVLVFVGASQAKISLGFASSMQALGDRAQYVQITGNGHNALDFHIAFYLGRLASQDPEAYFHVISRDTGFDPLIEHLRARKIPVMRSCTIEEIPLLKAAAAKTTDEQVSVVIDNLRQRGASKPASTKTLLSTVNSLFQNQLTAQALDELFNELQKRGAVQVSATNKLTYALPPALTVPSGGAG